MVTARDAAGNQASVALAVIMLAPPAPPMIEITSPDASAYSTASETIGVSGVAGGPVDVAEVVWTNDRGGSGVANGRTNWTIPAVPLQRGMNVVQVTARGVTGGMASDQVVVLYEPDTNSPKVSISSPTKGARHNTTNDWVAGVAVDDVEVTTVTWTSSSGQSGTATGTSVWSAEGDNVLTVTARDAAGNSGQAVLIVSRKSQTGNGTKQPNGERTQACAAWVRPPSIIAGPPVSACTARRRHRARKS